MRRATPFWALAGALAVAACGPSGGQGAAVRAWYDCIECDQGELDTLVARADWRLLPTLSRGLQGPSSGELARTGARVRAEHTVLGPGATPRETVTASMLSNFIAQRQRRAAAALSALDGPLSRPLARRALTNARDREAGYRDDVREAIRSALVDTIEVIAGDGQTDSAWRPVSVPPRIRVRSGAEPMADVEVRFRAASGGGWVEGYRQPTDSLGEAGVSAWIIGVGPNELVARAGDASAVFHATGLPATRMVLDSGFPSAVRAGSWVIPVVRLLAPSGQPTSGQMVRFAVVRGGRILRDSTRTDSMGRARPGAWVVDSGPNVLAARAPSFPDLEIRVWGLPRRNP